MQKEIEVKAKVESFEEVKKQLSLLGCSFSDPARQVDDLFVNFEGDYAEFQGGANFLRIRKETKSQKTRILFTLKQPQSNELDCIEKEVEISDAVQMGEALILMGYHQVLTVSKTRVKTTYKDIEICLDTVDGLGTFIELEKIVSTDNDGGAEIIQEELFGFLETLGIKREDRVTSGYDTLLYRLKHNQ